MTRALDKGEDCLNSRGNTDFFAENCVVVIIWTVIGKFKPMLFAEKVLSGLVVDEARQHDLSNEFIQTDKVHAIVRVGGRAGGW
jgi:hypothetical protein